MKDPVPMGCDDLLTDAFDHMVTGDVAMDTGLWDIAFEELDLASESIGAYCLRCQGHRDWSVMCDMAYELVS